MLSYVVFDRLKNKSAKVRRFYYYEKNTKRFYRIRRHVPRNSLAHYIIAYEYKYTGVSAVTNKL